MDLKNFLLIFGCPSFSDREAKVWSSSRCVSDPRVDAMWFFRRLRNPTTFKVLDLCGFASCPEGSLTSHSDTP